MKKFFLIFIPIILILTYIFYQNNLLPHPKYTNDDFGIQTYKSINDQDHDGISIQVTKKNLILYKTLENILKQNLNTKVSIIKVVTQQTIMEYVVMLSLLAY